MRANGRVCMRADGRVGGRAGVGWFFGQAPDPRGLVHPLSRGSGRSLDKVPTLGSLSEQVREGWDLVQSLSRGSGPYTE